MSVSTVDNTTVAKSTDRPSARIRGEVQMTVDPSRKREFIERFRPYALTVLLHESSIARLSYWRVHNADDSWSIVTGFDIDLERALQQLDAGTPLRQVTLDYCATPRIDTARYRGTPPTLTGGPFCVVCGEPGGLPCPKMVKVALQREIKLFFPVNDARLVPNHVHPGRCRKRLKALSEVATGSALP